MMTGEGRHTTPSYLDKFCISLDSLNRQEKRIPKNIKAEKNTI